MLSLLVFSPIYRVKIRVEISWSGIEVVTTGLTRNQLRAYHPPWVRIPPAPPSTRLKRRFQAGFRHFGAIYRGACLVGSPERFLLIPGLDDRTLGEKSGENFIQLMAQFPLLSAPDQPALLPPK